MEYNQLFQDCDTILSRIIENGGHIEQSDAAQITSKIGGRMKSALDQLQEDKAIVQREKGSAYYDIRQQGREIHNMGGYKAYLQKKADKEAEEKETKELSKRKLKVDLANAERVYNTYRSTRIFAIVSFIFATALALLKLAEYLKLLPSRK